MEQASQSTAPNYPPLELGPRTIPMPEHVSSQAQQLIAMPRLNLLPACYPPLHAKAAWRNSIAEVNAAMKTMEDLILPLCPVTVNRTQMNGARAVEVTPSTNAPRDRHYLLMKNHGSAYVYGETMVN